MQQRLLRLVAESTVAGSLAAILRARAVDGHGKRGRPVEHGEMNQWAVGDRDIARLQVERLDRVALALERDSARGLEQVLYAAANRCNHRELRA